MYKSINLEISLKPFKQTDENYIKRVCRQIFEQWYPILKECKTVSIMLWASDGSEILDYSGNLEDSFEWCKFIGTANLPLNTTDDDSISPHDYKYLYTDNPPVFTYNILKNIVNNLKSEGKKRLPDAEILVGHTFDIGPEFAISDFKYNRHNEICSGATLDKLGFVDCTALLNGDNRHYATYPDGIPDGTPIAEFLGKQTNIFLKDMGMDFIWLSNGFGFSADPWSLDGKVYDGKNFKPEKLGETKEKVFNFWKLFIKECPDFPIKVRGTNNSVGIDYATDAVPIYDIYRAGFDITPPPNSPWAAIDDNYGLELMGHMTRICELPKDDFLFRYYLHDPWWMNTPWYDRYCGYPTDIYMPMAISRIDEEGNVKTAEHISILSIDNSLGNMPDCCVNEPIPHLIKAKKESGDAPAPLVWVYPFREYSTTEDLKVIVEMYNGDNFIKDAINSSLPLNCVVSTDNFMKHNLDLYSKSILISPIPENEAVAKKLSDFEKNGGRIVYYGTDERLSEVSGQHKVSVKDTPKNLLSRLSDFGFEIKFNRLSEDKKTPTMTISKSNNGLFFSIYSSNTTDETLIKFPLGAPVLLNGETALVNGYAKYNFSRFDHRECRFFVKQESGVVSAKETACVNIKYRRRLTLSGLENATVYFFPESYCIDNSDVGPSLLYDRTPEISDKFTLIKDPINGDYYKGEGITGDWSFYMPRNRK